MVEKRNEQMAIIEPGETWEINACDPCTGQEMILKFIVLEVLVTDQGEEAGLKIRCRFTGSGLEFLMPMAGFDRLRKVKSDYASLHQIRRKIERVDRQIVKLLAWRINFARIVAEMKRDLGQGIEDKAQEVEIERRIRSLALEYSLDSDELWTIFQEIIKWSKKVQEEA